MQFEYHPTLVEQVVFLASRKDAGRERELHHAIDGVYAIPDPERKELAFQEAYADQFRDWRLGAVIEDAVSHWEGARGRITRCVVFPADRASEEHVDLLAGRSPTDQPPREHTILIRVRPQALLASEALDRWLRAELYYLTDMLDEGFGYRPDDLDGASWEQNVRRDRYMVLWRIHVAGRLSRRGGGKERDLDTLRQTFRRAFRVQGQDPAESAFAELLNAPRLTHAQFMQWAQSPETLPHTQMPPLQPVSLGTDAREYAKIGSSP